MCRLYVFRSTEATKVECTLVHAQNALMAQSRSDLAGLSHAHGWGIVSYEDGKPQVDRQAWAAYHGEHFTRAATRTYATTVLAHVRRATVGDPSIENTHPFVDGEWSFAHNGTLPRFDELRPKLLACTSPEQRSLIQGDTDSEHLFRHLLTLMDERPDIPLTQVLRIVVENVEHWVDELESSAPVGLNLVLTNGHDIVGTRWGRTLHFIERQGVYDCEICGFPHIHHSPDRDHRAVVIASEPITHEVWKEIPDRSLWQIDQEASLLTVPI